MFKPSPKPDLKRIGQLIIKYLSKDLTPKEAVELTKWVGSSKRNKRLFDKLKDPKFFRALIESNYALIDQELDQLSAGETLFTLNFKKRYLYMAAAILISVPVSVFTLINLKSKKKKATADQQISRNNPSPAGIILTLADGRKVDIDSATWPITQGNMTINKFGNELTYIANAESPDEEGYNTITTIPGKNISVVFADGSKVWLNAASSVYFRTAFNPYFRAVELTGEAYFEIKTITDPTSPGHTIPFFVSLHEMNIIVKGTRFNVKAYKNEDEIKTSLFEGSIEIRKEQNKYLIQPGQQVILKAVETLKLDSNFNEEEVLGWRNDLFVFNNQQIEPLMREISRWYNVEVVYEDIITTRFTTTTPRTIQLEQLLKILELNNSVHFRFDNNKVIVSK